MHTDVVASGPLENACRSLLQDRKDRKDTRVFAHAAAETMGAIFDTYQQQAKPRSPQGRGSSMHTGPALFHSQETGFLEVWEAM